MANPNQLFVLPQTVQGLAKGFIAVAGEIAPDAVFQFNINSGIPHIGLNINNVVGRDLDKNSEIQMLLKDGDGIPAGESNLNALQAQQPNGFHLMYKDENNQTFFLLQRTQNRANTIQLVASLKRHFNITNRQSVFAASLAVDAQESIRFRQQSVSDLQVQVEKLGEFLVQMGKQSAETIAGMTVDLQKQFQQKQNELDERASKQKEQLDSDRQEFEKKRKEFDDRQRTHVRRDLLDKIQKNIEARKDVTAITPTARNSRGLIHFISWLFLIGSIGAGLYAGHKLYDDAGKSPFDWRLVPPFSIAALVCAATLIFYFRWTSRWSDRLAHSDLAAVQYASDILRASWIAELMFEYKDEKDKEIPPEVLASLTEGLFKRDEFKDVSYHPSDDLSRIFRQLRSFKAGPQGVEANFGKK